MRDHSDDPAMAERMQDPAFVRAYDAWLLVLTQRAAEIELARTGSRLQRPRRRRARLEATGEGHTVSRTA